MDPVSYVSLISSTKLAFSNIQNEIGKPTFPAYFSILLEDCGARISQSLSLIQDILLDSDMCGIELVDYMNNAVCLLQLLSDLIKNIMETVPMACSNMKKLPTTLGNIISNVFIHCKDSESLYGGHLKSIENQLKGLFRTCHELQLTYLIVLEKHFIFDMTKKEEQNILIEALDINLKIGDTVQSLDVKTTADQWMAYTAICAKYATHLMDKSIYDDCTKVLCVMAVKNIKTALEPDQEHKTIFRALKVSRFALKMLLKICNIFKHALIKDQRLVLEVLAYIYLNNRDYLETIGKKSAQFINYFEADISSSGHLLLTELVVDEQFVNCVFTCDVKQIRVKGKNRLLGLIILVVSMIKSLLQHKDESTVQFKKLKFIDCIYSFLPYCRVWFNSDLKFKLSQQHTCGLYEYLLTHTVILVMTMTPVEFNALEQKMVGTLLGNDSNGAMFSANLWELLARVTSRELLFNQVVSLCNMYQTLENNNVFGDSPQQIHFANTISTLFHGMLYEDKTKIYNMYDINNDKNICLWTVLKISNLPMEILSNAQGIVMEKFKMKFRNMCNENIEDMIRIMNLASTCKFLNTDEEMEMLIIKAWMKACPKNNPRVADVINKKTVWYFKYVRGLVIITSSMEYIFHSSENFVKVLHTISGIIHSGTIEMKLLLTNIICKLANLQISCDMNKHLAVPIITQIFRTLFHDEDITVRNKLFYDLRKHASYNLDRIISKVINEDNSLRKAWVHFEKHGTLQENSTIDVKQNLQAIMDIDCSHKCLDNGDEFGESETVNLTKATSNNFDFADIDMLLDNEIVTEPECKKAKLNTDGVIDEIISRLEEDTTALGKVKENMTPEYQKRIKKICNKLASKLE